MGANNSTETGTHVQIPRAEYFEKVKYYGSLEKTVKDEKLKYSLLKKELEETKVRAAKKEESLKSQLQEYESLPILKSILNTLTKIKELDDEINNYQRSNTLDETTGIQNEIQQLRISVDTLSKYIDQKVLHSLPNMQINELRQLEDKVRELSLYNKSRETKYEEIHMQLSATVKKTVAEIENILLKIREDIEDNRTLFNTTRDEKAHPDFHKIKSILMEEENVLLQYWLTRPQNHNLIFCNLPDKSMFGKTDYQQVQEILKFIGVHEDVDLNVRRVGRVLDDKPKLLKVTSPKSDLVEFVLNRRYKLKGSSEYSSVGVIPDKRENLA